MIASCIYLCNWLFIFKRRGNMKQRFIISIITCILCLVIFSFTTFAWFAIKDDNLMNNISSSIEEKNFDFDLYYYDDTWSLQSDTLNIPCFKPDSILFFKLDVTNTNDTNLNVKVKFNSFQSSFSNDVMYNEENDCLYVVDNENNQLVLEDLEEGYFSYVNNTLKPESRKIEDVVKLYVLPSSPEHFNNSDLELIESKALNSDISLITSIDSNDTETFYFALKFESTNDGINDYDNYYQYQTLLINGVVIKII